MACYATMATPPEDDFPTKTTAEALRADRDRTGASKMTVEVSPDGAVAESGRSRPSAYNLVQKTDPDYERLRESRAKASEARENLRKEVGVVSRNRDYRITYALRYLDKPATFRAIALAESFAQIGPRAQSLLVKIAERLARGARQYGGDFDDKPRDWNKEALEEHMDAVVYMAMACMERDEAKAADKARAEAANRGPSTATAMPPIDMRHYNIDPRDGAAPTAKPIVEGFHTPVSVCGCFVCNPPEIPDWEKTRDGCG